MKFFKSVLLFISFPFIIFFFVYFYITNLFIYIHIKIILPLSAPVLSAAVILIYLPDLLKLHKTEGKAAVMKLTELVRDLLPNFAYFFHGFLFAIAFIIVIALYVYLLKLIFPRLFK